MEDIPANVRMFNTNPATRTPQRGVRGAPNMALNQGEDNLRRESFNSATSDKYQLLNKDFSGTATGNLEMVSCPYGCCSLSKLSDHLFKDGFVTDSHYDVVIKAFGKRYKLHKLFLDRSPYFKSLFSWSNQEERNCNADQSDSSLSGSDDDDDDNDVYNNRSSASRDLFRKVYELPFVVDDLEKETIQCKQKSFELAISRLYGVMNVAEEMKIPYHMIEIGQYLAIPEIVCTATEHIVNSMDMSNIADNLRFAITRDYGTASQRIIENGKGILCSNGWEKGPAAWDKIPTTIIAEVVGEDYFFVPTEWDRCIFIMKLVERRMEAGVDISSEENTACFEGTAPLLKVLNEKIHYCHMSPGQLQELEEYVDINGDNYIKPQVLHSALWQAVQLETLVTRAVDTPNLDNLISSTVEPSRNSKWFRVPSKDETLSGLPKELDNLLNQSLSKAPSNKLNPDDDSKSTQGDDNGSNNNDILSSLKQSDEGKIYSWTKIPPFRFSISFSNVSELSTDKRVYGKTFWYAGSYWNLYLQKSHIPSKNSYQVGVYLHRAHNASSNSTSKSGLVNPDIFANNPNYRSLPKKYNNRNSVGCIERTANTDASLGGKETFGDGSFTRLNSEMQNLTLQDQSPGGSPLHHSEQLNPLSSFSSLPSPASYNANTSSGSKKRRSGEHSDQTKQSLINYEDHRRAIKVYFIIFTPSRRSNPTITSFLSVPNDFSKSQSWGWKSNNMCVFNEDGTFAEGQDPNLKFMILLGNV